MQTAHLTHWWAPHRSHHSSASCLFLLYLLLGIPATCRIATQQGTGTRRSMASTPLHVLPSSQNNKPSSPCDNSGTPCPACTLNPRARRNSSQPSHCMPKPHSCYTPQRQPARDLHPLARDTLYGITTVPSWLNHGQDQHCICPCQPLLTGTGASKDPSNRATRELQPLAQTTRQAKHMASKQSIQKGPPITQATPPHGTQNNTTPAINPIQRLTRPSTAGGSTEQGRSCVLQWDGVKNAANTSAGRR